MSVGEAKLFGTDGVRGVANRDPVTPERALALGQAAARVLAGSARAAARNAARPTIVVGRDTRQSGGMLESSLVAGITSLGCDALLVGVLPTPGVAVITRSLRASAGVVISASHNEFSDNGIKFFRGDGYKLDDNQENCIEMEAASPPADESRPTGVGVGRVLHVGDALGRYIEQVKASVPRGMSLDGIRIVVDCANGAAFRSTPCVLRELGAEVLAFHCQPDGRNINADCGSTHPGEIQRLVREAGATLGITHDGDADRVLLCDEAGEILDGDELMAIAATAMLREGWLAGDTLVATVMSNAGLGECIERAGGRLLRAQVGDRHVLSEMLQHQANLGGEQSGHMIFRDFTTTGDGAISALQILRIARQTGQPLSQLKRCIEKLPQAQRSLQVASQPPLESLAAVRQVIADAEARLGGRGRVLVRYSGTEPKARILVEGREPDTTERAADEIAAALAAEIGGQ